MVCSVYLQTRSTINTVQIEFAGFVKKYGAITGRGLARLEIDVSGRACFHRPLFPLCRDILSRWHWYRESNSVYSPVFARVTYSLQPRRIHFSIFLEGIVKGEVAKAPTAGIYHCGVLIKNFGNCSKMWTWKRSSRSVDIFIKVFYKWHSFLVMLF